MSDPSDASGEWKEYRRLVMRDLTRLETQIKDILRETDGVRGNLIAMSEQVETVKKHLDNYTAKLEEHQKVTDNRVGKLEQRVDENGKALANLQGRAAGLGAATGGLGVLVLETIQYFLGS